MSTDVSAVVGFAAAAVAVLMLTPVAIAIARRADFYDHPREYRRHSAPTPFLGGAAVLCGVVSVAVALGTSGRLLLVLGCAAALWLVGTIDDWVAVSPKWRLLAEAGAAGAVFASGLGWETRLPLVADLILSLVWVVGLVNAFNLMDNLDGACGTVAAIAAAGIGLTAAIKGDAPVAVVAFVLAGACAGFLPWNLAGPARVFLGDGGTMPIGFLIAVLAMAAARHSQAGNAGVLLGALLAGLPILDVALVSLSRVRRGVSLMTGGRDHLTHRILLALRSPRLVAATLGVSQAILCAFAVVGYELGPLALAGLAFTAFGTGVVAVVVLDMRRWRPAGIAVAPHRLRPETRAIAADRAQALSVDVES
jgi:UDP-GlcNAc:undecaprenyl-phosphate GlcNAc-1-phosphate transferase